MRTSTADTAPSSTANGVSGARVESGPVVEHAETLAFASPEHVLPAHSPEALASSFTLRIALSAAMQFLRLSPLSTYEPSQKMAPSGLLHLALQPPVTSASHDTASFPRQSIWQSAEASASHDPLQEPEHLAEQSAVGGVPLH